MMLGVCTQDWRAHYEQMHSYNDGIESTLSETKVYLDKLHQEISKTLEKISSREKYINNQVHVDTPHACIDVCLCTDTNTNACTHAHTVGTPHPRLQSVSRPLGRGEAEI